MHKARELFENKPQRANLQNGQIAARAYCALPVAAAAQPPPQFERLNPARLELYPRRAFITCCQITRVPAGPCELLRPPKDTSSATLFYTHGSPRDPRVYRILFQFYKRGPFYEARAYAHIQRARASQREKRSTPHLFHSQLL